VKQSLEAVIDNCDEAARSTRLESLFGRDPSGRLEITPNGHLITCLRLSRQPDLDSHIELRLAEVGVEDGP